MLESEATHNDAALLRELRSRVDQLFDSCDEPPSVNVQLAKSLVRRLNCLQRLLSTCARDPPTASLSIAPLTSTTADSNGYDTLKRSLAELENDRNLHTLSHSSPVSVVENALLWSQIDTVLERVLT